MSADAFLLPVGTGFRFCLLRLPANRDSVRGSVLLVPPFAEELNKSRRMIALAAERIVASGYAVLQIDCVGCGDSSGDFGDATWEEWLADIRRGYVLLADRYRGPVWLWGVRAGALLAAALLERIDEPPSLLFWQPVVSGRQHLTQFLRLKFANEFLGERGASSGTQSMMDLLTGGETLEIAGYRVTPALAMALAKAELVVSSDRARRIACLEVAGAGNESISPALGTRVQRWKDAGMRIETAVVRGVPFWQTQQITEVPELLDATARLLDADR